MPTHHPLAYLPSPPINGFHLGPLYIHFYGLMYVIAITAAIIITRRRWQAVGGDPALVGDVAIWAVPVGLIGARIYFDITTPAKISPHTWWGPLAIWNGGLGVWGGILAGALVGIWRVKKSGADWRLFADAIAPALLVAQAIGRVGNYFNQELFGKPSGLPWALEIAFPYRPPGYTAYRTFQPTFLYELIFDLALAALLVWLGHHKNLRPPALFTLYVAGYSAFRIFEETVRIDYSQYILGLRLNFFIALIGTVAGLAWFVFSQRAGGRAVPAAGADPGGSPGDRQAADESPAGGEPKASSSAGASTEQ